MTLYQCPLCRRQGFTRAGLARHYCPATEVAAAAAENWSPLRRRRRLTAEEIARATAVAEAPPSWGPYRLNDQGWYVLEAGTEVGDDQH